MSDNTRIEYVDASWNPIRGCDMSQPCSARCWARRMAHRHTGMPGYEGFTDERGNWTGKVALIEKQLAMPLKWRKSRRIAAGFMGDLFHPNLPDEDRDRVFAVTALTPQHWYLFLSKRAREMREYLGGNPDYSGDPEERIDAEMWGIIEERVDPLGRRSDDLRAVALDVCGDDWPLPNVLLGVSVSSQADADKRREPMKALAALGWNTWCSYEPALGPADWRGWEFLSWLVTGGESGPEARPMHPDWARAARDFAIGNKIPFFFKQWGEWLPVYDAGVKDYGCEVHTFGDQDYIRVGKKAAGSLLDGQRWEQVPEALRCPA